METASVRALRSIQANGQFIRTAQALKVGIHPRTLSELLESGDLEQISRGGSWRGDLLSSASIAPKG